VVDHNLVLVEYLNSISALTNLLGTFKVVAGQLPEKFDPEAAPGSSPIVVISREGGAPFENAPIKTARMKVRVWAGINQYKKASDVYAQVFVALHGACGIQLSDGVIIHASEEVSGQDITDPDTNWATVLSYWSVTARQ